MSGEHNWVEEELRAAKYTAFGWQMIDRNRLNPLLNPPEKAHKRLVRLFYQNMRQHLTADNEVILTVSLDGWHSSFTKGDLAKALGIPASFMETDLPFAADCPVKDSECWSDLNEYYPIHKKHLVTRRSSMRIEMWFVDHFIMKQLYPIGHGQERRKPVPRYLWCASKGFFVDAAQLIFDTMWKVAQSDRVLGPNKVPPHLPYMRFITALLKSLGYLVQPDEPFNPSTDFPIENKRCWRLSYIACLNVHEMPDSEVDDETETHRKWTDFFARLPHLTPPGFVPYVAPRRRRPMGGQQSQTGAQSQTEGQGDATEDQGQEQEQEQGQFGVPQGPAAMPEGVPPPRRRRRRHEQGASSSAGPAGDGRMDTVIAGIQGLQMGFQQLDTNFGQRMDQMQGQIGGLGTQFQTYRTDFDQFS